MDKMNHSSAEAEPETIEPLRYLSLLAALLQLAASSASVTASVFIYSPNVMTGAQRWRFRDEEPRTVVICNRKGDAVAIETELLRDYRFGQQQLIELWGQACALAITKAYPLSSLSKKQPTVLVICGPDQNGSVGLVCARHLRIFDYEPTIYHPKRSAHSLHQDFTIQCEKMDIPFLSYLPTEVSNC
ncbi:yjeF N-terminal domain-containing protein 3-like isoform X1 [Cyprinodon tularosa]|uniref:yjeF N-terminal domain-containing protein 3-like isoform X1 n=1 Tax=Cyprinodon tularosa TaxID=77115 RepID=UPI0018E28B04|nr:yjeF N-terminal domain-containing protein 3-like isoform X1 [Cyprinodon tularosa]